MQTQGPPTVSSTTGPFVKQNGKTHPWKPRTPSQIAEFAALWRNADLDLKQIARRYKAGKRTIQVWRKEFGLPTRGQALDLARQGMKMGDAAELAMRDIGATARVVRHIEMASMGLPGDPGAPACGTLDAEMAKRLDPFNDPEIMSLLEEVRGEARRITSVADLTALNRKLSKLSILSATKMPVHTWESLQALIESLSRGVLWTRKVEAELPSPEVDQRLLRQEAGRQMMQELREVLNSEDQATLAAIVKKGADLILTKHKGPITSGGLA